MQEEQAYAALLTVYRAAVPILCRALRYPNDRIWDAFGKGSTSARIHARPGRGLIVVPHLIAEVCYDQTIRPTSNVSEKMPGRPSVRPQRCWRQRWWCSYWPSCVPPFPLLSPRGRCA